MSQPTSFPFFPSKTALVMLWRLRISRTFHRTSPVHEHRRIFRILLKPSVRATPASSSDIRAEQCQQTLLHPRPWEINRSLAAMRCTTLYQPFRTAG
ncbi:hypothetical protein C8J57DRAFT_1537776 [Mycena rebaudengoi]|nr:hypothetical protein C8J57DRAFT_1537776 [Mycena rebaudengoi]